ncbi:1-deoxy-D-xylulose-5-phosphate synthase domain protein [Mycobacterium xenopi 3993]|nr:1-deoxy-D-xylulose-5-phosphate synthase domain protein [Mycobacterium xenopi 3993]
MQRQRQLYDAEVGTQVSAGGGDFVDQKLPDLVCQIPQLCLRKGLQIGGPRILSSISPVYARTTTA